MDVGYHYGLKKMKFGKTYHVSIVVAAKKIATQCDVSVAKLGYFVHCNVILVEENVKIIS